MKPQEIAFCRTKQERFLLGHAGGRWGYLFLYIRPRGKNTKNHLKPP